MFEIIKPIQGVKIPNSNFKHLVITGSFILKFNIDIY